MQIFLYECNLCHKRKEAEESASVKRLCDEDGVERMELYHPTATDTHLCDYCAGMLSRMFEEIRTKRKEQ